MHEDGRPRQHFAMRFLYNIHMLAGERIFYLSYNIIDR
jgi:hypothetical protein